MMWNFKNSPSATIDWNQCRYIRYVIDDDAPEYTEIKFINGLPLTTYILQLSVAPGKKILWVDDTTNIRFGDGYLYEENSTDDIEKVYLGFYTIIEDEHLTFMCIAIANNFAPQEV